MIGSHFHRQVLASFVYITDTVALISGFAIVPVDATLVGVSVGIVLFGFAFFGIVNEEGKEMKKERKTTSRVRVKHCTKQVRRLSKN